MSNELTVLERQFDPLLDKFTQVLQVPGVNLTAPRLVRSVLISCERTPKLMNCTRQSLFNAAMSAACLGLEVDGVTGQAFLIPFDLKGQLTAQLVVGYKGFNTLGARSGITITAEVVRDGDAFDFDEGEAFVKHKKLLGKPGRRIIATWAKAAALDRPAVVKVLDIDDVLAIKRKSPGAKRSDSPWNDEAIGFPAMAEKSAKRRLARAMPLNVMQTAARMDEAFEEQGLAAHITPASGVVIDQAAEGVQPSAADLTQTLPTTLEGYREECMRRSTEGIKSLEAFWNTMPSDIRVKLKPELESKFKPAAWRADEDQQ